MAIGDFGLVLDSKPFLQVEAQPPNLRKRTKNVVLLLTQTPQFGRLHFRSIAIDDEGLITGTPLDTFDIMTVTNRDMALLHWLDDVYVAYSNDHFANGHLYTVGCDTDGEIADSQIGHLGIGQAANATRRSELFKPHDGILLTAPCYPYAGVHVQTVAVPDSGILPDSVAASMPLPTQPMQQRLRQGAGDWIVDLASTATQHYIRTFTCTDAGVLPAGETDSWGPIATTTVGCSLCNISNTVFAVFVENSDGTVWIHTFSINENGTIKKEWLDSEQVDDASAGHLEMIEMGGGYFVLSYTRTVEKWRFKTYYIATDGTIQDGHLATMDRATDNRGNQIFEHIEGNIWTHTYESTAGVVFIDTMEITTPTNEQAHNELMVGIGP